MLARTPRQAVDSLVSSFRQAVSCVTGAVLSVGSDPPDRPHVLTFVGVPRRQAPLRGERDLAPRLLHAYALVADAGVWRVHTTGYSYELQLADGREIVAYHYDPSGRSRVLTPHLHVRGLTTPLALGSAHFPTGRVPIEAVVRFAIEELGVSPRRPDWQDVLARGEEQFRRQRTW